MTTKSEAINRIQNGKANGQVERSKKTAEPMTIPDLEIASFSIWVIGDTELVCHKWSRKAIQQMLGKHMGEASAGREIKNPMEDFLETLYTIKPGKVKGTIDELSDDGHPAVTIDGGVYGFPSVAFKAAMVESCTSLKKAITKVAARQAFHVMGELTRIQGQPRMRQDMVRLNGTSPDIRFRGGFRKWAAQLLIRYNARVLTAKQIISLLNTSGFGVGVGEHRPQKNGPHGCFHVGTDADAEEIAG